MTDTAKILPKLRFPEFENDGEWKVVNGNELFKPIVNKNHNSDLPVLAITQEQGAVPREMIDYTVIVSDKSIESYKVVEIGDFIISLRSFQGGIEYSNYKGLCSPAYIVLRKTNDNVCNDFYKYYFKSHKYIQDLNRNLEGIRDGKMVSYQQFSEIKIPFPSLPEQQKIASFLTLLDEQISAHTKKLEALKAHKKGLMQQLFPANGEKTPKLRFPEFKNAREWKEILLGEVANVYQGYGFPDAMQGKKTGKYPFYKVSDISNTVNKGLYKIDVAINYVDDDDLPLLNNAKPIPPRTIIFAKIGEAIRLNRRVITIKESLIDNNTAGVKAKNREFDDMFLFYIMIMIDLIKFAGGVVPAVKKTIIENIQIIIPEIPEQQKIASFLTSIDEMIQAQDDKIQKLKTYKNGLMQQMFANTIDCQPTY